MSKLPFQETDWTKTMNEFSVLGMNGTLATVFFFCFVAVLLLKNLASLIVFAVVLLFHLFAKYILKLEIRYVPSLFKNKFLGGLRPPRVYKSHLYRPPLDG